MFMSTDEEGKLRVTDATESSRKYVNENVSRMPTCHFEPMFRALLAGNYPYNYDTVDLVADSEILHKLCSVCAEDPGTKSFRIDAALVGKTLFLSPFDKRGKAVFKKDEADGSQLFLPIDLMHTPEDLKDSTTSWRVLRYSLGSLNCIVRSEVDATFSKDYAKPNPDPPFGHLAGIPDASDVLPSTDHPISIVARGQPTPLSATARVATTFRANVLDELMPQLYFDRTRLLVHVFQRAKPRGYTNYTKVFDVAKTSLKWQKRQQKVLKMLVKLLRTIRRFANDNDGRCIMVYEWQLPAPKLHFFSSRSVHDPLPEDIVGQFWTDPLDFKIPGGVLRGKANPFNGGHNAEDQSDQFNQTEVNGDGERSGNTTVGDNSEDGSPTAERNHVSKKFWRQDMPRLHYEEDLEDDDSEEEGDEAEEDLEEEDADNEEDERVVRDSYDESSSGEEGSDQPIRHARARGFRLWIDVA